MYRDELEFEWDEEKAAANFRKHGIRFETAVRVFQDPNLMEDYDDDHSRKEDRYKVIGKVDQIVRGIYGAQRAY